MKKIADKQSIGFVEGLIRLAQSCIHSLMKNGDDQQNNKRKHLHLSYINVARMRFLQSCVAATTTMMTTTTVHGSVVETDEEEGRRSEITLFLSDIAMCLQHMTKNETFRTALSFTLRHALTLDWNDNKRNVVISNFLVEVEMAREAVACAAVEAFSSLLRMLLPLITPNSGIKKKKKDKDENDVNDNDDAATLANLIRSTLRNASEVFLAALTEREHEEEKITLAVNVGATAIPPARRRWIVRAHLSAAKVLAEGGRGPQGSNAVAIAAGSIGHVLLGKLGRGDEAVAIELLEEMMGQVPLLFYASIGNRKNVDSDPGNKNDDAIVLRDTLLVALNKKTPLLPLGPAWPWLLASGDVTNVRENVSHNRMDDNTLENANLTVAALHLLEKIESRLLTNGSRILIPIVDREIRLRGILGCCLLPEIIVRDERFTGAFRGALLAWTQGGGTGITVGMKDLGSACDRWSSLQMIGSVTTETPVIPTIEGKKKALVDFAGELCTVFIEYGAQYEPFPLALRSLLRVSVPAAVRVEILTKIHDLLHLLTTEEEVNNASRLEEALSDDYLPPSLTLLKDGGSENNIDIGTDPWSASADFLETLSSILRELYSDNSPRVDINGKGGFIYLLAVGHLSYDLARAIHKLQPRGIATAKHRLRGIDQVTLGYITSVMAYILHGHLDSETSNVAQTVVNVCMRGNKLDSSLEQEI